MATISGTIRDSNGDLAADVVVRAYRRDTGALLVSGLSGDGTEASDGDDNWASVALLLHMDGTDGSTTFTDSSTTPKTVTAYGNAHIETDESRFGGASAYFDGNGDYLSIAGQALGTGNFSVEGWFYLKELNKGGVIFDARSSDLDSSGFALYARSSNKLTFGRGNPFTATEGTTTLVADTWYHAALTRSSGTVRGFLNGNLEFTVTGVTANYSRTTWRTGQGPVLAALAAMYVDDLRATPGVARYTDSFTAPDSAFPNGGDVVARPLGEYTLTDAYTGEWNIVALDPDSGDLFNDQILRVIPG